MIEQQNRNSSTWCGFCGLERTMKVRTSENLYQRTGKVSGISGTFNWVLMLQHSHQKLRCETCEEFVACVESLRWREAVLFYSWPGICCCKPLWCRWHPEKSQSAPEHLERQRPHLDDWRTIKSVYFQSCHISSFIRFSCMLKSLLVFILKSLWTNRRA